MRLIKEGATLYWSTSQAATPTCSDHRVALGMRHPIQVIRQFQCAYFHEVLFIKSTDSGTVKEIHNC